MTDMLPHQKTVERISNGEVEVRPTPLLSLDRCIKLLEGKSRERTPIILDEVHVAFVRKQPENIIITTW